jgi:hypothetical protein
MVRQLATSMVDGDTHMDCAESRMQSTGYPREEPLRISEKEMRVEAVDGEMGDVA